MFKVYLQLQHTSYPPGSLLSSLPFLLLLFFHFPVKIPNGIPIDCLFVHAQARCVGHRRRSPSLNWARVMGHHLSSIVGTTSRKWIHGMTPFTRAFSLTSLVCGSFQRELHFPIPQNTVHEQAKKGGHALPGQSTPRLPLAFGTCDLYGAGGASPLLALSSSMRLLHFSFAALATQGAQGRSRFGHVSTSRN